MSGGYNIHAVYNATHGKPIDFRECQLGLNNIATEPVRLLHQMWNNFFENNDSSARFLMISHRQGNIHLKNGLLDFSEELRQRIDVVAIAPGGYIYPESCGKLWHYCAAPYRDIVPQFDRAGAQRAKDTIIRLKSHPDAPWFDHPFLSPTYKRALGDHIKEYITNGL